jgi:hydrogenase maturation protease
MKKKLNDRFMIIGLGSPIMTDDAVGLRVVQAISDMHLKKVDTLQEAVGGLEILPMIRGYRNVIIVDAIQTYQQKPGTVMIYDPDDFDETVGNTFAHDINLATALKIGEQMDPDTMPDKVMFIAVEVQDIQTMSETMTPEVEASVGPAINAVLYLMEQLKCRYELDRTS